MLGHSRLLVIASATCLAGTAWAEEVVLKDGRTLTTAKPYVVKGKQALLTLPDGTLVSLALSEIDVEKTAAAAKKAAPVPSPAPTPVRPLTPAEAARVRTGKKATFVLTTDQVAQVLPADDKDEKKEGESDERVDIATADAVKDNDGGYRITGSVVNSGKGKVSGVSVVIEAIGDNNLTLASTFGQLSKDSLDPGEKSVFQARLATDKEAKTFRYVPRWVMKIQPKDSETASATGGRSAPGAEPSATPAAGTAGEAQKPAEPAAAPTPIPRPDMPARVPNAPLESPAKSGGGAFLPKPTGDQPKPPGGS